MLPREVEVLFPLESATQRTYKINSSDKKAKLEKDESFDSRLSNESSILFRINIFSVEILLTGDSKGKQIQQTGLGISKGKEEKGLTVFQVPHHGSEENSYVPWKAVKPLPIDHPLKPLQRKHQAFKHALFFYEVRAEVYFISYGDNRKYQHPHRNVITGILVAATVLKTSCTIVVTGTFHLDKIVYPPPEQFRDFPRDWRRYVTIRVPFENAPFLTIDPQGDDPFANTKEWSPEPETRYCELIYMGMLLLKYM